MRLLSSHGELVRGRCASPNLCGYCAKLAAVENAELLALDALAGSAPAIWACLTTRTATLDSRRFYRSREQVVKALRRRWPSCEYAALVEFTTGYGSHSGGRRRPHWNLLLKGVPAGDVDEAAAVIRSVWCARENARPEAQHVGQVAEFGGLMRYIALHFQKESQRPPEGWRGWRFLKSRGYLATSTPEARQAARESLRHKREVWRAIRRGLDGQEAENAAQEAIALAEATTWRMIDVTALLTAATRATVGDAAQRSRPGPATTGAPPRACDGSGACVGAGAARSVTAVAEPDAPPGRGGGRLRPSAAVAGAHVSGPGGSTDPPPEAKRSP